MTQEKIILEKLKTGEWITSVEAVQSHILRLGAIIHRLKEKGYTILSERVPDKPYQRYKLVNEPKVEVPIVGIVKDEKIIYRQDYLYQKKLDKQKIL